MSKHKIRIEPIQKRIRKVLDSQSLTLDECAKKLGISRQQLHYNLNNKDVKLSFIYDVCDVFGGDFKEILFGKDENNQIMSEPVSNYGDLVEKNKDLKERVGELKYTISIQKMLIKEFTK